jgi:hypothetical protein
MPKPVSSETQKRSTEIDFYRRYPEGLLLLRIQAKVDFLPVTQRPDV